MNTRDIAEEYRLTYWAGVMQERQASGLNVKEFCKTAGFHSNTYFYWQRKLREAASEAVLSKPNQEHSELKNSLVPSSWAVYETVEPKTPGKTLVVEIGGYRIEVEPEVDQELLAKVCRVLKSIC